MTIYLAFNESEALNGVTADVTNITTTAAVIAGVNRAAVQLARGVICTADLASSINEGWLHAKIVPRYGSSISGAATDYFLSIVDENNNQIAGFYQNNNSNGDILELRLVYFGDTSVGSGGGGTDTGLLVGNTSSTGYDVDLYFLIDDTVGILRWYIGGTLVREVLGDTQNGASDLIKGLRLRSLGTNDGTNHNLVISQVIMSDEPTIGARLHTLALGTASTNDWDGTLTDVTGTTYNTSSTLSTDVAADEVICATGDIGSINSGNEIKAVIVSTAALSIPGSPVTELRGTAVISSTTYNTADVALEPAFAPVLHIFETNPATTAKWTLAEVNAAEFGFEARA